MKKVATFSMILKGLESDRMNQDLNARLAQAQQGSARLQKIDAMLKELRGELQELETHEKKLKRILEQENIDVEKLENKGLAAFFYSVMGNLEERIEKERSEALAARLKYDQALKDIEEVHSGIAKLSLERLNYVDCPLEYKDLYAQKRKMLLEEKGAKAQEIIALTDEVSHRRINLKEINEAIAVGNRVLDSLNNALGSLSSAEGWGTWDLLGGGMISGLAKHSHINSAQAEIEKTQSLLRQFRTELTDIRIGTDLNLKTEGFIKFADFFFDGIIADWFMQSRINESQASVENIKNQVQMIIEKLLEMKAHESECLQRLDGKISELIVKG
ncbi:hypothetical protein Desde_2168 [Desulfitobacterium dehalogenans ATCC 51507]|uniref:Uncharacterized protein n=1 Tax=Desulfitobacterium dehalogenans (strain ATCC 51507 / DSM 9161 / JW/IU-DC1) TaxID=756499 RepID=I4A979_DESDJ|nr:hypothetical protein [Desulfitobacterium dehalogenans]AFM00514.1 hypothetical protein Desde_2168 [Desulfitobacterium dehalogenans ATCC 51507]